MPSSAHKLGCGVAAGFVFLATVGAGATPAHAASSDPLTPPSGWTGVSESEHWVDMDYATLPWFMEDPNGNLYNGTTGITRYDVPADSVFIDLFHSVSSVRRVGDRIDFLTAFRQAPKPFNPYPVQLPGAKMTERGYPGVANFELRLRDLLDDVESLSLSDFTVEGTPIENLTLANGVLRGTLRMHDNVSDTRIRFSATYTGEGNDVPVLGAYMIQPYFAYGAEFDTSVTIPVEPASFDVFKTADVSEVKDKGDEVTYTVKVGRIPGAEARSFTLTDDMSDVLKDAERFTADDIELPQGLSANASVTDQGFVVSGEWPTDPTTGQPVESLSLKYTVSYDGTSSDDELVNSVCVTGRNPALTDDCADASVAVGEPSEEEVKPPVKPVVSPSPSPSDEGGGEGGSDGDDDSGTDDQESTPAPSSGRDSSDDDSSEDGAPQAADPTPTLSRTGASVPAPLLWAGGLAVALGGVLIAAVARRGARRH